MDNSSNINKPGNDKLSKKKKFLNLGIENETSGDGITSASNEHIDPVEVTHCDSDPGTAGGSSDRDNAVKIQNKGADDLSVKADDACPQAQAAVTDSEGKGEPGGRVEEDIEIDAVAEPPSSDFNNSGNNELERQKKNVNCDQERQEEPIEVDGADGVQPERFDDGEKTKENGNEKGVNTKGLPKEEANTVPPSFKNADGEGEKLEATGTSKLNDLNKNDLNEEATGKAESIINTSISVATAANIDEDIDVDGYAPGLSIANGSESDDTQEYSMKTQHAARQDVNYDKKDFGTDSDLENSSDGNNQAASSKRGKEKRRGASPMGLSCSKSNKDDDSPPIRKKQKSSSSEEEDVRPWRDDPQDAEQRKKDGENVKPSSSGSPLIGRLKRQWSDRDTQMYRQGYPGKKDHPKHNLNLKFYRNEVPSSPNGAYIDEIHEEWWHDHDRLESHHGYIQWLFPIRESGMNWHAQELQQHEAEAIQKDEKAMERFVKSYEMMLHFYGLKLLNRETGEVDRAKNWRERFHHLNCSMHNYLRITRILKCLGELGLERYKAPFLRRMLCEAIEEDTLDRTLESCYNYWIGTLRDSAERKEIKKLAEDMYEQSSLKD